MNATSSEIIFRNKKFNMCSTSTLLIPLTYYDLYSIFLNCNDKLEMMKPKLGALCLTYTLTKKTQKQIFKSCHPGSCQPLKTNYNANHRLQVDCQ